MKYATFSTHSNTTPRPCVIDGDTAIDLGRLAPSLLALIQQGPSTWARVPATIADAASERHPLASITWHAPIPRPAKNIICLGMNYAEHIREAAGAMNREVKIPKAPVYFTKSPTSVTGPFDEIRVEPGVTQQVDWEAELGVVIGAGGRNIRRGDALSHVFGYTIVNDVSARDLQRQHMQFFKGKSLDTFCPMGPVIVSADEFGDPQSKGVRLRVNGVTKQDGRTSDMIFPIDAIIETFSQGLTIEPGDIFSTGTPDGVGMGRTPQEWLQNGDVVETEIDGIGTMRNRVVYV